MSDTAWLAKRFEEHRDHLRGVAYRMLGSFDGDTDPEHDAALADSVGLALLVVLETLAPAERTAFVLHDMFGVAFEEIAAILDRSPAAARQLASRARRRVRGAASVPSSDLATQRRVVDAFFAAAHDGDFEGLLPVLDPEVVLRADFGPDSELSMVLRGAHEVAGRAILFSSPDRTIIPAAINGAAGVVVTAGDKPFSLMAFTVDGGRIVAIDAIGDPDRLAMLTGLGS